jgi:hypothetical protein
MLHLNKERVKDYLSRLRQTKAIIECDGRYYYVELYLVDGSFHHKDNYIIQNEIPLTKLSKDFLSITPDMYF